MVFQDPRLSTYHIDMYIYTISKISYTGKRDKRDKRDKRKKKKKKKRERKRKKKEKDGHQAPSPGDQPVSLIVT